MSAGRVKCAAVALAVAGLAGLAAAPARSDDERDRERPFAFAPPFTVPALAPSFEQEPPLPDTCGLKKDDAFKALGRNPGPPAVAHRSGGRPIELPGPAARAPFPQLFPTGEYTIEPNIGITSSGALFVDALKCGPLGTAPVVLRSTDQARTFEDVSPSLGGAKTHQLTQDPYLYVDKRTDRVFSTDIDKVVACQPLSLSDDQGRSWTETQTGCSLADHANMFAGPAPAGGAQPSGYANVVYYCAIDGGALAEVSKATSCVKSLDGGLTSVRTGEPAFVADPAVTASNPTKCDGGTGPGFVDSAGTVYLPRGWCGQPWLAMSRDEGRTWERVQVADNGMSTENDDATANQTAYNHEAGVRVDARGTIYYVWVAHDRLPYLAVSRDGGRTWSRPMMFGPPGVRQAWNPTLDIAPSGRIAMSYMASTNAPPAPAADGPEDLEPYRNATWNGYMTISDDALAADPTFYTASVSAPDHPFVKLAAGAGQSGPIPCAQVRCGQEFDFIDLKMARDGTPWAIFVDACSAGRDCISPTFGQAVAARLVTPGSAAALDAAGPALLGAPPAPGAARRCRSRRSFVIRVHRPRFVRIVSARVYVNGRRVAVRRGRRLTARVDLRGLPPGRYTVTIKARTATGRTITGRRRYRTCAPGRPDSGRHKR